MKPITFKNCKKYIDSACCGECISPISCERFVLIPFGINCNGCKYDEVRFCDICYYDCIQFSCYELKQYLINDKPEMKEMEKIQMTKEQAKDIIETILGTAFAFVESDGICYIDRLEEKGYIRKSELETLVEQAEDMYNKYYHNKGIWGQETGSKFEMFHKTIQALKTDHPEFKK